MPFTIDDAITLAESWFEETLDDAKCLIWGNEFIRKIVNDKLYAEDTQDYADATADTWNVLPADFRRLVGVKDSNGINCTAYHIKNGLIRFDNAGSYTLTYIALPAKLADITTEVVPLPDDFEYPMAEYLIFRYFKQELDDDDSYNAAAEYEVRCHNSLIDIYNRMEIDSEMDSFQVKLRW